MISTNKRNPLMGHNARGQEKMTFPNLPDAVLVDKLVEMGQPRRHALVAMRSVQLRAYAIIFYFDCIEAEHGNAEAKVRVDYCRDKWQQMRAAEKALGNDPEIGAPAHVLTADKLITL